MNKVRTKGGFGGFELLFGHMAQMLWEYLEPTKNTYCLGFSLHDLALCGGSQFISMEGGAY